MCFCMAEGRTCRKVSCFCVFLLGRKEEMSKSVVFLYVFWVKSKSVVFLCVFGFCVFLLGRRREMSKSVVFSEKCRVFVCFLGKVSCWAFASRVHNLLYNVYGTGTFMILGS